MLREAAFSLALGVVVSSGASEDEEVVWARCAASGFAGSGVSDGRGIAQRLLYGCCPAVVLISGAAPAPAALPLVILSLCSCLLFSTICSNVVGTVTGTLLTAPSVCVGACAWSSELEGYILLNLCSASRLCLLSIGEAAVMCISGNFVWLAVFIIGRVRRRMPSGSLRVIPSLSSCLLLKLDSGSFVVDEEAGAMDEATVSLLSRAPDTGQGRGTAPSGCPSPSL